MWDSWKVIESMCDRRVSAGCVLERWFGLCGCGWCVLGGPLLGGGLLGGGGGCRVLHWS